MGRIAGLAVVVVALATALPAIARDKPTLPDPLAPYDGFSAEFALATAALGRAADGSIGFGGEIVEAAIFYKYALGLYGRVGIHPQSEFDCASLRLQPDFVVAGGLVFEPVVWGRFKPYARVGIGRLDWSQEVEESGQFCTSSSCMEWDGWKTSNVIDMAVGVNLAALYWAGLELFLMSVRDRHECPGQVLPPWISPESVGRNDSPQTAQRLPGWLVGMRIRILGFSTQGFWGHKRHRLFR